MSWKYLNPGDHRLLNQYNAASVASASGDNIITPTGMSFYNYSTKNYPITVPSGLKEIWLAFSFFSTHATTSTSTMAVLYLNTPSGTTAKSVRLYLSRNYDELSINTSTVKSRILSNSSAIRFSRILLHVKSDSSNGAVDYYLDGELFYSVASRNVMGGEEIRIASLSSSSSSYHRFSDIIISDEPIDLNEHVAVLPVSLTTAVDWTYDTQNNVYTTDSADKTIWQVPNVNQLKSEIGLDNPTITSVAIQAYNISSNDTLTVDTIQKKISQNNSVVVVDSATISGTTFISSALTTNPVTSSTWTLNDLSNIQFGITTAKS